MNRLILIGNGFDIAHGLKTRYVDFLEWYWEDKIKSLEHEATHISKDPLSTFISNNRTPWCIFYDQYKDKKSLKEMYDVIKNDDYLYSINLSVFLDNISNSIRIKGWVDIENEYYKLLVEYSITNKSDDNLKKLNEQLQFMQYKLVEYLSFIDNEKTISTIDKIKELIYAPILESDIALSSKAIVQDYLQSCLVEKQQLPFGEYIFSPIVDEKIEKYKNIFDVSTWERQAKIHLQLFNSAKDSFKLLPLLGLPDNIMLLSFNYTSTASKYIEGAFCEVNYIHGELNNPNNPIIFGYGDELDKNFKDIQENENNECLSNVKSIKYSEADSYRKMSEFIESAPFQIYIIGHSCGNSDRTLLNTLFEHENCISIKPYYYKKDDGTDNYTELVQNISRNFTDTKLMRDRVVNKTKCTYLPQANNL